MKNQIYPYVILITTLVLSSALVFLFVQNIKPKYPLQSLAKSLPIKAEIVSYYSNGTHVIFYVKFYEEVNRSDLLFYVNNKKATIIASQVIKPGETIKVIAPMEQNQMKYSLFGTFKGTYYVLRETVIVSNVTYNFTPVYPACTWFLPDWHCRVPIYVTSFATAKDFQLNLSLDTQTLISQGKLRSDCGDLRFTAVYPYEGTNYTEGLILGLHFDNDVKDYSGLNNDGNLISGKFVDFIFNKGLENGTVILPPLNVSQFTITLWLKVYNNTWEPPEDWWDPNWKYRIPIYIYNNNTFDIWNYPVKVTLDTESLYLQGKVNPDLSDIRVIQKLPAYKVVIYNPNSYDLNDYQMKISVLDFKGNAMYFDGDNDYIEVRDSLSLDINDFLTICAWIKTNASTNQMIVGKNNAYLLGVVSSGVLYFNYYNGSEWVGYAYSNSAVNDDKFHFVCVTYNSTSGEVKFYIDGRLDNIVVVPNQKIASSDYVLRIGDIKGWDWFFNGTIDEVRIYNITLTEDQIKDCYLGACPVDNLVLYFSFDDGTAKDLSGNGNDGTIYGAKVISPGIKGLVWKGNFSIFNPSTNKYLNYCFEQPNGECNTTPSDVVWVKVDYLPANSNITLYMLPEEKNNATSGDQVFDFYDDFNDGVLDMNKWTVENSAQWTESGEVIYSNPDSSIRVKPLRINTQTFDNIIIEAKGRWTSTNDDLGIFVYGDANGNAYALWHGYGSPPNSKYCIAVYTSYRNPNFITCYSYDLPQGLWGRFKVLIKNNGEIYGKIWEDGSTEPDWTVSTTVSPYGGYVGIWYWDDDCYVEFDWIRIRKYADQEPIVENITLGYAQIEIPFIFETSTGFNTTDSPSTNTTIWFKAKYLPASANTTVYIYYGNPHADPTVYAPKDIFLIYEDFDTAPNGILVGDAYYDPNNKYVVLTQNTNGQTGYLVYNVTPRYGFYAKFYFKIGLGNGADAAWLGAYDSDYAGTTEDIVNGGYHFTFDEYQDRICFTKSTTDNGDGIICQTGITNIDNWQWHEAEVYFWYNSTNACTKIYYDSVLAVEGCDSTIQANVLNRSGLIVFGGRTGGSNNYHIVGIKLLLVDYLPNIIISYGQEESLNPQRRRMIEKPNSFGLEILEDRIYGFVNTTDGYKEISYKIDLGNIYFTALSYDGSHLKLYINGNLVNYTFVSGNVIANNLSLTIDFQGIIDELRIYNVSLTQDRILKEYKRDLEKELVYYVENCNSTKTKVYVRLPFLANETIYMYYCNPNADSVSTFEALKLVDEDFNDLSSWHIFRYSNDPNNECYLNNGLLYLTTATNNKGCMMFYKERIIPFYVKFRYSIGGGSGADGMAFAFDKDIEPYKTYGRSSAGGSLGLMAYDGSSNYISDGYAVEFDNYENSGDPSANHIALIRTNINAPYNHLAYYNDNGAYTEDDNWHIAEIWLKDNVTVIIDGNIVLTYSKPSDLGYYWVGFGAGTGGATNKHVLDWVEVYGLKYVEPWPKYILGTEETC